MNNLFYFILIGVFLIGFIIVKTLQDFRCLKEKTKKKFQTIDYFKKGKRNIEVVSRDKEIIAFLPFGTKYQFVLKIDKKNILPAVFFIYPDETKSDVFLIRYEDTFTLDAIGGLSENKSN